MILKLSLSNVKKSINDYMVYFLTLTFSVCLFYTFNSFESQSAIMELSESQSTLLVTIGIFMKVLSVFVALILGFLILYANNFLIKRRKKEFGLYLIMGMPKHMISKILICETLFVGLISLCTGLILGAIVSQGFSIITANLFQATYQYHFVYSYSSMLITTLAFSVIFFVVMIFNARIFNKVKVIDLLHAKAKNENAKVRNVGLSILIFITSIILLAIAYVLALDMLTFFVYFLPIIVMGIAGTFLFFMSLSGFFIQVIKKKRGIYFKGLNSFILKQVNAKINTNFVSMSIISLLLLLSIGAFACGFNLSNAFSETFVSQTPYSISIRNDEGLPLDEILIQEELQLVQKVNMMHFYTAVLDQGAFFNDISEKIPSYDGTVTVIPLSDFNAVLKDQGRSELQLSTNQVEVLKGRDFGLGLLEGEPINHIEMSGQTLEKVTVHEEINLKTEHAIEYPFAIIAHDSWIEAANLNLNQSFYNIQIADEASTQSLIDRIYNRVNYVSKGEVYENGMSLAILFTYIGLYLGFVFLMASAVILALQQLSQANDNKTQYECLLKIGADQKMVHHALFKQIAIYFGVPLVLSMIHSYIGVKAVMNGFSFLFGFSGLWSSSLVTSILFILVYGLYFLVTYFGCRKIITHN